MAIQTLPREVVPDGRTHAQEAGGDRLPARSIFGYGLGDFGNNLAFSLSTAFLLYYYTDVAGLTAAMVGTMFLIVRLWDAVADITAGRLVDRTMTRWGKFRPFILFGAVPLLFLSFLTFHVPAGLSYGTKVLYAYLTYAIFGFAYSLVNIPYGSLASAMTQSVHQRAKLVAARAFGAAVGGVVLTYIIAPQISALRKQKATLGGAAYHDRVQAIFTQTTLIFVVLGTLAYLLTFLLTREQVVRVQDRVSLRDTWATLRHNRALGLLCAASFCYLIGMFAVGGASAYYAQNVLGDIKWLAPMTLVNIGLSLVVTPFLPKVIGVVGKKRLFMIAGGFTFVGGVGVFLVPTGMVALALFCLGVMGIGNSLVNTTMFGLEADTVEYGEWKSGQRAEGATYAVFSFTRKVTQSLGGAIGAWALAFGGYLSTTKAVPNPVQPDSAILAIKFSVGLLPAIAAVIAVIVFSKYPLTDELFKHIRDTNEARKRAGGALVQPEVQTV